MLKYSILFLPLVVSGQFAPQVGQAGSTAVYKDSNVFVAWANACSVTPGLKDVARPQLGYAGVGTAASATGKAGLNGTITMGDAGTAVLTFEKPIANGPGADFAVFENGFQENGSELGYLEYAFVEVSSDGENFFRFPAAYSGDTATQITSFQTSDTRNYHNLAGKYWAGYGTPFDLEELKDAAGLDVNHITHVKIVDVIGTTDKVLASRDSKGTKIIDPYPTDFAAGGFDLDAVGVIHQGEPLSLRRQTRHLFYKLYPVPAKDVLYVSTPDRQLTIQINDLAGNLILKTQTDNHGQIDISQLPAGTYLGYLQGEVVSEVQRIIIQ